MQKLGVADKANKPTKDNPGTFFLDTAHGQSEVLALILFGFILIVLFFI